MDPLSLCIRAADACPDPAWLQASLQPVNPVHLTSSSSSLASSGVDTSSRPCGFAFAGAGSICSHRASPGPAELRRARSAGRYDCLCRCNGGLGSGPLCEPLRTFNMCFQHLFWVSSDRESHSVRHRNITDVRTEPAEGRGGTAQPADKSLHLQLSVT